MNKKNKKSILDALMKTDAPASTKQIHEIIPAMNERTLRRGLAKLQSEGCLTQTKGGRGYSKGVSYTIQTIDKQKVSALIEEWIGLQE